MERINNDTLDTNQSVVARGIESLGKTKKKVARGLVNGASFVVAFFLLFVVVVVFTTDIDITSFEFWAQLGLTFFILIFCSYSMYINFVGTGTRAGKIAPVYTACSERYDGLKKEIMDNLYQSRICEFCRWYIDTELEQVKTSILLEVGVAYKKYVDNYLGKDKKVLKKDMNLSKTQVKAIIKANNAKPITLTPEMILRRGRGGSHRAPLGTKPETKRNIAFVRRLVFTVLNSVLTGVIAFEIIEQPTWATFAAVCIKLLPVIINGFMGYTFGYENITVDTVNYMSDQTDLMQRLIQYVKNTPESIEVEETAAVVEQSDVVVDAVNAT